MKYLLILVTILYTTIAQSQELYVFTDPASNAPARSITARVAFNYMPPQIWMGNRYGQRYAPEAIVGLSKKFMMKLGTSFANVHTPAFKWESIYLYGKYRFLSKDELHSHFRMAVFADASYSKAPYHTEEMSLMGDRTGVQAGIIATQLWNKLAVSASVSHVQLLDSSRFDKRIVYVPSRLYQGMNYTLSAGYLVLPVQYKSYKQTNLNLYAELLAQQSLDRKAYYVDLAPAAQLIFNSAAKLNVGYRFQLGSSGMIRMSNNSWLASFDYLFLNAWKKKKK